MCVCVCVCVCVQMLVLFSVKGTSDVVAFESCAVSVVSFWGLGVWRRELQISW